MAPQSHNTQTDSFPAPRFGVNYTPSVGWFHHWLDFNIDDVKKDLDSIVEVGADHIRIFALWPLVQPNRTLIRPQALTDIRSVVDAAAERNLDVSVDGLQGHLSSFDFLPSWVSTWHKANLFTDDRVLSGQAEYLTKLAGALDDRPNFLGMSLGNEFSQFASSAHPDVSALSIDEAEHWLRTVLTACETGAPGREHQHSEYDAAWFDNNHSFTPALAARVGSMTTVHSWVFNGTAQKYGGTSEQSARLAEYLIELSRGWAVDPARPVWLQEVGAPAPFIESDQAARFTEEAINHALDCDNLWGVTWWCSHDVSTALADFPSLEYSLGLLDNARSIKPQGQAFARAAATARDSYTRPAPRSTALVLDVGDEATAPNRSVCAPGGEFFNAWMTLAMEGERPAVVLTSQSHDSDILETRGIKTLVLPSEVQRSSTETTVLP
ncbi:glycosyl hydrolase [Lysinibacter sp. HNR]|uniref:glycoside hydrolase 5 family protein n=1 Tax=Lysinibacter sp. HNR TaxID=3031408 RepID=UPI0024356301|nr:glycosyl hydrolase [Lysinibacter sp. HNR]WGD38190.1 glycosyl hydrolase [Lysinibacter sp. HNR]